MKEELYGLANHIAGAKGGLPQDWQDWANEIEMDLRKLANWEAQPVALVDRRPAASGSICWQNGGKDLAHGTELFTAPPAPAVPEDYFGRLVEKARVSADKAMRKFPQPNYVLNKVAEESGEVIKAVIHYTEGREEWANVEGEIIDNLAMLIRLVVEGDQIIGFTPPDACRAAILAQPVSGGYKLPPHVYRELVNSLRDTAVKFSGTEQLRERLNTALSQFIEPDHPHTRTVAPEGGNDHDTRR
ncbi:TPA: hypothetical protein ACXE2W_002232 [Serratia marcescens]